MLELLNYLQWVTRRVGRAEAILEKMGIAEFETTTNRHTPFDIKRAKFASVALGAKCRQHGQAGRDHWTREHGIPVGQTLLRKFLVGERREEWRAVEARDITERCEVKNPSKAEDCGRQDTKTKPDKKTESRSDKKPGESQGCKPPQEPKRTRQ